MAGKGGRTPGSGRKSNAQKLLEAGFVAPFFGEQEQARVWKSMLASEDEKIVLDTAKYLTDRIYGKAPQSVDANVEVEVIKRVISDL